MPTEFDEVYSEILLLQLKLLEIWDKVSYSEANRMKSQLNRMYENWVIVEQEASKKEVETNDSFKNQSN